ncbi:serine/threonine-protein kinase [Neorhodopirellula pilleata]|uniref:serine/threonine-protein kinase n=1 Tax=Neorhodopirellula pilleata TaxID=2714738 RepID=UPI0011B6577B
MKRSLASGVLTLAEIKTVVASLMADDVSIDCKRLTEGLQNAGLLTRWQASKLLAGKSKGFYLGAYKLLRPLGKGGMGMVYLGEHHVMKRQMALKVLPPDALKDARRIERFKEEARASAQLDHPNIVRAYDFNEAGSKLYIVMEFVDGIDLHQVVARDGVMSIDAAIDAITQACQGLAHAHERGVIHRDIKPSNLMLRSDGVVKVSDMGLARIGWSDAEDSNDSKRLLGTADFVAPEQALNSKTVDARADIYSLGCTLYFLLTARSPFRGENLAQRLAKHQTAPIPNVRELREDCPPALANLLVRMMAKKPADRPSSAADLLTQLERLRGGPSASHAKHEHLAAMVSGSDTAIDDKLYQATMDDSSIDQTTAVEVIEAVEVLDDFDFASLPPLEAGGGFPDPLSNSNAPGNGLAVHPSIPSQQGRPIGQPGYRNTPATMQAARSSSDGQMVILGVGLAIAVLALVLVVGVAAYMVSQPLPDPKTPYKATEPGKRVIVVTD